jgi:hypothetical protein
MVHVRALHNEIWQNVIRQACGDEDGTDDYRIKRQATLTNLMYVSRVSLTDACATVREADNALSYSINSPPPNFTRIVS